MNNMKIHEMKVIISLCLFSLLISGSTLATDPNKIVGQNHSIYSADLDSDISIILYVPDSIGSDEKVTPVFYIFGDFLFESFSGSINYLSNELSLIPKCILIGINEIPEKQIGQYQKEYSKFIANELIDLKKLLYPYLIF